MDCSICGGETLLLEAKRLGTNLATQEPFYACEYCLPLDVRDIVKNDVYYRTNFHYIPPDPENIHLELCRTYDTCIMHSKTFLQLHTESLYNVIIIGECKIENTSFFQRNLIFMDDVHFNSSNVLGSIIALKNLTFHLSTAKVVKAGDTKEYSFNFCQSEVTSGIYPLLNTVILDKCRDIYVSGGKKLTVKNSNSTSCTLPVTLEVHLYNCTIQTLYMTDIIPRVIVENCIINSIRTSVFTHVDEIQFIHSTVHVKRSSLKRMNVIEIDSTITEPEVSVCVICKEEINEDDVKNIKNYVVHGECFSRKYYSERVTKYVGEKIKGLNTFGFELELKHRSYDSNYDDYEELLLHFIENDFLRTADSTVTDELKSPIYNTNSALLQLKDHLNNARKYITDDCGTHIHVGIGPKTKAFFRDNKHVFAPMSNYLDTQDNLETIWGRSFGEYCINEVTEERYSWLNFTGSLPTVEYRLPVLVNFDQYWKLLRFVRQFTRLQEIIYTTRQRERRYRNSEEIASKLLSFYIEYFNLKGN